MSSGPVIRVIRQGDTSKRDPFTIAIIANPALEAPWRSGVFVSDPIISDLTAFDASAQYVESALFGRLPNQVEYLLAEPTIAPKIRVVSLHVAGLPPEVQNSLVGEDSVSSLLVARRANFVPFLAQHGLQADVAYAVSKSISHTRASAWFTSDDDAGTGTSFTFDGMRYSHRHRNLIPGTVAIHTTSASLTALHEFGHALSSYTNGSVVDLYVDSGPGLNNKRGRPVPSSFAEYNGTSLAADATRDGLGYPANWQSYHCELVDTSTPAVIDNFWQTPTGVPEQCQHDRITRQFLEDRLRAKTQR